MDSRNQYDGYRVQLHINSGKKKVFTRNGLDWTKRFSTISGAFDITGQAIIDGEVVVIHEGRTNFSELQAELAAGRQDRLVYYAFDLLWRDGDLRKLPQLERKQLLGDLIGENDVGLPVLYSEHLTGDGQKMFEHAVKLGWEGIISKRADAPYRSERTESWLKIKTVMKGKFPIIGFIKDPTGVAALYLGKRERKELVYMGKVGAGWNRTTSSQIRKALDAVESPESKLTKAVKKPKATWVDPVFTADIEYRDVTSEGLLRQSSFKGLKRNAALKSVFHYMSEPFPHLMEYAVQIAWDYLEKTGQIDDGAFTSRFLMRTVEDMILTGERRRPLL
ncbi:non-homologous end-joining DNA ligase [Bradyrhizobium sp. OAE829]|uniref:non-homologous end-joining DNA ligase n=1 Tax=Bradyrhizobium sp. OAE829 TaxID=2663807 RepID=UPI0019F4A8DB